MSVGFVVRLFVSIDNYLHKPTPIQILNVMPRIAECNAG